MNNVDVTWRDCKSNGHILYIGFLKFADIRYEPIRASDEQTLEGTPPFVLSFPALKINRRYWSLTEAQLATHEYMSQLILDLKPFLDLKLKLIQNPVN